MVHHDYPLWSVCNGKSSWFNCSDISRLSSGSCFRLPFGIFQIFCAICNFEKLNFFPVHVTMFAAASQSEVNGVHEESVFSKVSGFEIQNKFFSYKMFT